MSTIRIPPLLLGARDEPRCAWVAALPARVAELASDWELELGEPYLPGGRCAWVAPARGPAGEELVLKVGWRHPEAEHEAEGLLFWDGQGAVRCFATRRLEDATALLLERCVPGIQLKESLPEAEQDVVVAGLLRRLWDRKLASEHPFRALEEMCEDWAASFERGWRIDSRGLDPGLAREAATLLRELPRTAPARVLLATDLHAENILSARREPWLMIDPKPYVGDPAYDVVQHMLNCDERLAADPVALSRRVAGLVGVDEERVRLWLFARCAQESLFDVAMRAPARRLAG